MIIRTEEPSGRERVFQMLADAPAGGSASEAARWQQAILDASKALKAAPHEDAAAGISERPVLGEAVQASSGRHEAASSLPLPSPLPLTSEAGASSVQAVADAAVVGPPTPAPPPVSCPSPPPLPPRPPAIEPSLARAISALSPDEANAIFNALDSDGDGCIVLEELQVRGGGRVAGATLP